MRAKPGGVRYFLFALLLIGATGSAELPGEVEEVLSKYAIPTKAVSVHVRRLTSGDEIVLSERADQARHPASTIKLLTTFAALDLLGAGYTWDTEAWTTSPISNGVLDGDLVLRGHGDPFLTTDRFWRLLFELRLLGLKEIRGNLVVDGSYFTAPEGDPGDFDGRPYRVYNAPPEALVLNFQSTRFTLAADEARNKVQVAVAPPLSNLEVDNRLRLVTGKCKGSHYRPRLHVEGGTLASTVVLTGEFSTSCERGDIYRLAAKGAKQIYGAFRVLWSELGGTLSGDLRSRTIPADAELFYTMRSLPLSDLIRGMNKFSNNLMTRQLLLTLGAELFEPPATTAKGRDAVRAWLDLHGLQFPKLILDNGAGLSRKTRISAQEMGTLLKVAFDSPQMPEFISSLPIAAVDGTMRKRLREDRVGGRAHIKTGSLDDVSTMAGYVLGRSGHRYAVVAFINHQGVQSWQGKQVQDTLLRWVHAQ